MALILTPTKTAVTVLQSNTGEDFIQHKTPQGKIVHWFDINGNCCSPDFVINSLSEDGISLSDVIGNPTKTLYVDGGNSNPHPSLGTKSLPFKKIQDAINQIIMNGDNSTTIYAIDIAAGTYNETIVLEDPSLVNLIFVGHRYATVVGDPVTKVLLRSVANNDNLQSVLFFGMLFNGTPGFGTITLQGASNNTNFGNGNGINFFDCNINVGSTWTSSNVGGIQFFNTTFNSPTVNVTNHIVFTFLGDQGPTTGTGVINIVSNAGANHPSGWSSTQYALLRGCRSNAAVSIDAGSTFLMDTARQAAAVTTSGLFQIRNSSVSGAITVNSGGTFQEIDSSHTSTLTINAGGTYSPSGTVGMGALVLAAAVPNVPSGLVAIGNGTAASATAGAVTLPAAPAGFLIINVGGTAQKIPYYNN